MESRCSHLLYCSMQPELKLASGRGIQMRKQLRMAHPMTMASLVSDGIVHRSWKKLLFLVGRGIGIQGVDTI